MALPEGYLPRKDDILTLRGRVIHDFDPGDDYVHVHLDGSYSASVVKPETIVSLACRAWREGEKVMPKIRENLPYNDPAVVLGIFGEYVWINDPYAGPSTYHSNAIEPWLDPKAALEVDEAAVRAMTEADAVAEAIKEPPPATGFVANEDDDDFPL